MRAAWIAVCATLCVGCQPGHEVDITIEAKPGLTPPQIAQIHSLEIAVLGTEPGSIQYPIKDELSDGKTTWIYKSKLDGPLQFEVVARGDARALIGSGKSTVVTTGEKAVKATIALGTNAPNPTKGRLGESCTAGVDTCASGFCVDGVCCADACGGDCYTCNGTKPGTCTPALAGTDPRKTCDPDSTNPCGLDGSCDGAGACRMQPAGKVCAQPTCTSGMFSSSAICDGLGMCGTPAVRDCAPYACNAAGNACATICTSTAGCAPSVSCNSGNCGQVLQGARCFGNPDCKNNTCVDGYCCDMFCSGSCQSCKEPGHEGTCTKTLAGVVDPHHVCVDAGATSCGNDGSCDGNGGCRDYPTGTLCAKGGCDQGGASFNPPVTCIGAGFPCATQTAVTCAPYTCVDDGAPGCATDCGECTYYGADKMPPLTASCAVGATCTNKCLEPDARYVCE